MVGQTRLNLRYNLARWFDAHETTGRYLVDADVQTIQRAMWNFSFLKLHVSVETFLSIYLSMVCLHTDLAESYPYFPQVGISLGKCSPIIFTTSWTCYCFWKDSMAGETQASCNCSHKVGTVSPQTIFLFPGLVCPTQKLKTCLVFSSLELLILPGMVWNLGTRNNWPMLVFNLVCFFYPNEAVTNWCTLMSSGEEKHGALKNKSACGFALLNVRWKLQTLSQL